MTAATATLAQRTALSRRDFTVALVRAWRADAGAIPTKPQAAVLFAQYGIETAEGKYCWNFNFGNVKCSQGQAQAGVAYTMLRGTWEIIGGKRVVFEPPHPATWFRAFEDAHEGMTFYLAALRKRFSMAWSAVTAGDPESFAKKLREMHYYTAPESDYAKGLRSYFNLFMKTTDYEDALAVLDSVPTEREVPVDVTMPAIIHPRLNFTRADGSSLDPEAFDPELFASCDDDDDA